MSEKILKVSELDPNTRAIHDRILKQIMKSEKNVRIADIGYGSGRILLSLHENGYGHLSGIDYDGADLTEFGIGAANGVDVCRDDLRSVLGETQFDIVIFTEVIEHLRSPFDALLNIRKAVRNGGKLILTTPNVLNIYSKALFLLKGRFMGFLGANLENDYPLYDQHIFIPAPELLEFLLKKAGFEKIEIRYLNNVFPLGPFGTYSSNGYFGKRPELAYTCYIEAS